MIVSLSEAKKHLRIDDGYSEEDPLLEIMIMAAEEFIKNATGKIFTGDDALAKVVAFMIITDLYENRAMTTDKMGEKTTTLANMMLTQLSFKGGV